MLGVGSSGGPPFGYPPRLRSGLRQNRAGFLKRREKARYTFHADAAHPPFLPVWSELFVSCSLDASGFPVRRPSSRQRATPGLFGLRLLLLTSRNACHRLPRHSLSRNRFARKGLRTEDERSLA